MAVPNASQIIPVIHELRLSQQFHTVILTQDYHPADHKSFASNNKDVPGAELFTVADIPGMGKQMMWPDHCVQGTPGCEFHPHLDKHATDIVVRKGMVTDVDSYSGFGDAQGGTKEKTELEEVLRERGITDVRGLMRWSQCSVFSCINHR